MVLIPSELICVLEGKRCGVLCMRDSPFAVRMEMLRVWPDGRVGGQADQPGSTRTLSPPVHGDDAGHVGTDILARPSNCAGNPKGQRYCSGVATSHEHHVVACDNPLVKGCSRAPSRLTCWAYSADITLAGSLPCSRCTQGMSWRHPATPFCAVGIGLQRQVQRLDVGRWTGASA